MDAIRSDYSFEGIAANLGLNCEISDDRRAYSTGPVLACKAHHLMSTVHRILIDTVSSP
jgi:hypothetical protein